ncbi:MAG: hypothetical protein M3R68_07695 [Acidobacteriota bacterium]|nr:hypothetical protein [Acidobacteriota bacterium]
MTISFKSENNSIATARAFATYALVPYLGILFCPGALLLGSVGVVKSYRFPESAGDARGLGIVWIFVATIELAAQLVLWWLLYKIPEWGRGL